MAILINNITHKHEEISYARVRARLDQMLVNGIDQNIWPSMHREVCVQQGPRIYLDLRSEEGVEPIVQSYLIKDITDEQALELEGMIRSFDELTS